MSTLTGLRGACLPCKDLEALAACLGLFAALADALPIQGKHLFLKSRQAHCVVVVMVVVVKGVQVVE